ncbi:MAG: PfkB family carbohydrate kinase [Fimbriimonadaceae bacterium]|nr:PfkB family carbohydrate kinase [Fimbriimonadaceae bacterium]
MSAGLLGRLVGIRAVVLGDLMLDEYLFGSATRISPEAPVMVVRQERTAHVPGGAANVARNIVALGGRASILGVAGDDEPADRLASELESEGIEARGIVRDGTRTTTRKTRVVADHSHQVLRIDHEDDAPVSAAIEARLRSEVDAHLPEADVLVLSDYLKGALTPSVAEHAVRTARATGVPVIVNPKPRSLAQYAGATLVSLNRAEVTGALDLWKPLEDADAEEAGRALRARLGVDVLLVTLGESGLLAVGGETLRVRAPRVEVYDTAGAGDTVIAAVALGWAAVGFRAEVFELAAQAAARVVQHVGVAVPTAEDLAALRGAPR